MQLHPRIGVSTWSLNRRLTEQQVPLLELPAEVAAHGLSKLEICHFHLPSTSNEYAAALRGSLASAEVEFYTLLVDAGDITSPDPEKRDSDEAFIAAWIEIAARFGATRVRVIAGDAPADREGRALAQSIDALVRLAAHANSHRVRLVTENWHPLLDEPQTVLALFDALGDTVGLKLDLGNWTGDRKYTDLAKIAHLAECTHAKAAYFAEGEPDIADFERCLTICRDAGFQGPHILIFSSPGDEWASLDQMREIVEPFVA